MQVAMRSSCGGCSTSGRASVAPAWRQSVAPAHGARCGRGRLLHAAKPDLDDHQLDTTDAFAELVRMAVAKDPSLAPLAEQHLKQKASPFAPREQPAAPASTASAMLGPSLGSLPSSSKPPWLRQRAPQGDKYKELFGQMRGLGLATVCEEAQCPNIGECWNGDMGEPRTRLSKAAGRAAGRAVSCVGGGGQCGGRSSQGRQRGCSWPAHS